MKTFAQWVKLGDVELAAGIELVERTTVNHAYSVDLVMGNVKVPVSAPVAKISVDAAHRIAYEATAALKAAQSVVVNAEAWRKQVLADRAIFAAEVEALENFQEAKRALENAQEFGRCRWDDSNRGFTRMAKFVTKMQELINGREVELREVYWMNSNGVYTKKVWVIDGGECSEIWVEDGEGRKPVDMFDAVELFCTPSSIRRDGGYWLTEPRTVDSKEPIRN